MYEGCFEYRAITSYSSSFVHIILLCARRIHSFMDANEGAHNSGSANSSCSFVLFGFAICIFRSHFTFAACVSSRAILCQLYSLFPKQLPAIFAEIKISLCGKAKNADDNDDDDASQSKRIVMLFYCHKLIAVDSLFRSCRSLYFLLWLIRRVCLCEWTCFTFFPYCQAEP